MQRTIRRLAVPLAGALLLAGCGSTNDSPEAADAEQQTVASDGGAGAPMDDGGDDDAVDESEAWPEVDDGTPPGPFTPEGAVGGTLNGSVYTLGALEPLPEDITDLLAAAGYAEKDTEGLRLLPVHIDNSQGSETEGMYSATAVTEDGQQYSYDTLGSFLFQVSEGYAETEGAGMGDPVYDALWERYEEESVEVAPTAKGDGYIVVEGLEDPDNAKFTYFAIEPPMYGEPISMAPIE